MTYRFQPSGVCSRQIEFEIDGGILKAVRFSGGCAGNAQGLSAMAEGRPAAEVLMQLRGIDCGGKGTSCPDQLARALEKALAGVK